MTRTFVIVPVKNEWRNLTSALLGQLLWEAVDHVIVLDNGSTDGTAAGVAWLQRNHRRAGDGPRFSWLDRPSSSIYEMWNDGFDFAERAARKAGLANWNTLYLNNDVTLVPGTVARLAEHLRMFGDYFAAYPDQDAEWSDVMPGTLTVRHTRGVLGDGGMFGPCFMLAAERIPWRPLVTDPAYHWWYGDNHLAECIELAGGKQVRVVGLPVKHVNEGTAQHYPELWAKKLHDRGQWITRHQRGYGVAP